MIIDTETHVLERYLPVEVGQETARPSLVHHHTWHAHNGDLLAAEMERAGVDRAFLISYDGEDLAWELEHAGAAPEDFWGGKHYTRNAVRRHPERFFWFTTVKDPRTKDGASVLEEDFASGAVGVKFFPEFIHCAVDDRAMLPLYAMSVDRGAPIIISLECIYPPGVSEKRQAYFGQIDEVARRFPDLRIVLNHGGMVDIFQDESRPLVRLIGSRPNLSVSCALPGAYRAEYPFEPLLRRIERLGKVLGPDRAMWATDWPYCEKNCKYFQAVTAFQNHSGLSGDELSLFMGGNAARLMEGLGT